MSKENKKWLSEYLSYLYNKQNKINGGNNDRKSEGGSFSTTVR